jgi:hypothetical protein
LCFSSHFPFSLYVSLLTFPLSLCVSFHFLLLFLDR